jgi:hypothetical protein|tara:strand:- start:3481 stop:3852 length:372 start_codon:yes stop_codon:yes gene_type:complete
MITEKQKRAADNIIQQKAKGDINLSKALTKAGYSRQTATKQAKQVVNSKGFIEYLALQGLTEETLAGYLSEDLKNKPGERLGEMKLASELLGLKKDSLNVNISKVDESLDLIKTLIDEEEEEA